MKTPAEIRAKCSRRYPEFLRSLVRKEPFFPLEMRIGEPMTASGFEQLKKEIEALANSTARYQIEWREVRSPRLGVGRQRVPERIFFAGEDDFLITIGKQGEVRRFREQLARARSQCPALLDWMARRPGKVIEYAGVWDDLLLVCAYFSAHPRPSCFARELPLPIGTKFVGEHRGVLQEMLDATLPAEFINLGAASFEERFGLQTEEPRIRFRFLDTALIPGGWPSALQDISIARSAFERLEVSGGRILIVENQLTFVTLPSLPRTMAIFGAGRAVEVLKNARWLSDREIWYWGDLDPAGFEILNQLRRHFPRARSIFMDLDTLTRFRDLAVPHASRASALTTLTHQESAAHAEVMSLKVRLEQEKLPHRWICDKLGAILMDSESIAAE